MREKGGGGERERKRERAFKSLVTSIINGCVDEDWEIHIKLWMRQVTIIKSN